MALYHKYRPQQFEDVVGQDHIRKILEETLIKAEPSHGYLFAGPRGLGKTTMARLLAKALNCIKSPKQLICDECVSCQEIQGGRSFDVIEIDAASNRGIDEIRQLREKIKFAPTRDKYKVFIIDEVHMLTKEAFNALLKTLEEPPSHAVFVMATTEPYKVPATIISRVQRFDFRRPQVSVISLFISKISRQEKIKINQDAIDEIARLSDGSFRDALTLLDQVSSANGIIDLKAISSLLGLPASQIIDDFITSLLLRDAGKALNLLKDFYDQGVDFGFLYRRIIAQVRDIMINESRPELARLINRLLLALDQVKLAPLPQIPLELAILEWCGAPLPKASVIAEVSPSEIDDSKWKQVIEATRPYNHSLAGILQEARVVGGDASSLTLAVRFAFYKDRIEESKNRQKILEVVHQVLGPSITNLVCKIDDTLAPTFSNETWLIDEAKELFGGEESPVSPESTN